MRKCFQYLALVFLLLPSLQARINVSFLNGNFTVGPYRTTKFSELIVSSNATVLTRNEDPCIKNSIETEISGHVVFAFLLETTTCYPDQAYENLERLGAVAVVNVGERPAGCNMYA
eukprot:snap_masked-scaffold_16-processed-gene-5.40-mRNA-1 protein AED:1.00 eAED:1.00 QI:0/0/0/0/1/1/2/0/115